MAPPSLAPISAIAPPAAMPNGPTLRHATRAGSPSAPNSDRAGIERVFYAANASSTISGGPGTDLVYLPGSPSDWVADGQGSYINRLDPTLRVLLQDVEVVRFYSADRPGSPRSILDAQA